MRIMAQDDETPPVHQSDEEDTPASPKQFYLLSPRVSVTVPHPMSNSSFKKCFVGIYEASVGLNLYIYKGVFLGATYKNGLLKITENKIADYNASMYLNNEGVRLGGDFYLGEKNKTIFSLAVTAGENQTRYVGLVRKDPKLKPALTSYSSTYVEPELDLYFLIESNFGIGVSVSYSIFSKNFDPAELGLTDWSSFSKDNSGSTQYLSFGFGFYYSLVQKKKRLPKTNGNQ